MTTKSERERLRAKWSSPISDTITRDGVTYYPPYMLGWQINVGRMRNDSIAKFFADDDKEAFEKEDDFINDYAERMKKKYGIGLPPGEKDDED